MSARSEPESGVKGQVRTEELTRQERSVARRSAETRAIVPSLELMIEVEMEACLQAAAARATRPLVLVLAEVAQRLRDFPRLNGAYRDGRYELYSRVNLGIHLPGSHGAVSATLFDAAGRPVAELEAELHGLAERALAGRLSAAELSGSTFTVLPPGPAPVTLLTPLIQPPQAAALAIGPTLERAVVRAGSVAAGRLMALTLACDQRIVQASQASEFLGRIKDGLEALTA